MQIESKRMLKGMVRWYKTVVHQDTEYYSVTDLEDGNKVINLLADQEGRVFRVVLSKEDIRKNFLRKRTYRSHEGPGITSTSKSKVRSSSAVKSLTGGRESFGG